MSQPCPPSRPPLPRSAGELFACCHPASSPPPSVLKMGPATDHGGPIMLPAGADTFKAIGRPRGGGEGTVATGQAEWRELYDKMFPGEGERGGFGGAEGRLAVWPPTGRLRRQRFSWGGERGRGDGMWARSTPRLSICPSLLPPASLPPSLCAPRRARARGQAVAEGPQVCGTRPVQGGGCVACLAAQTRTGAHAACHTHAHTGYHDTVTSECVPLGHGGTRMRALAAAPTSPAAPVAFLYDPHPRAPRPRPASPTTAEVDAVRSRKMNDLETFRKEQARRGREGRGAAAGWVQAAPRRRAHARPPAQAHAQTQKIPRPSAASLPCRSLRPPPRRPPRRRR
jgi:hypothetical protein